MVPRQARQRDAREGHQDHRLPLPRFRYHAQEGDGRRLDGLLHDPRCDEDARQDPDRGPHDAQEALTQGVRRRGRAAPPSPSAPLPLLTCFVGRRARNLLTTDATGTIVPIHTIITAFTIVAPVTAHRRQPTRTVGPAITFSGPSWRCGAVS